VFNFPREYTARPYFLLQPIVAAKRPRELAIIVKIRIHERTHTSSAGNDRRRNGKQLGENEIFIVETIRRNSLVFKRDIGHSNKRVRPFPDIFVAPPHCQSSPTPNRVVRAENCSAEPTTTRAIGNYVMFVLTFGFGSLVRLTLFDNRKSWTEITPTNVRRPNERRAKRFAHVRGIQTIRRCYGRFGSRKW